MDFSDTKTKISCHLERSEGTMFSTAISKAHNSTVASSAHI
jgi:hypothetical protein